MPFLNYGIKLFFEAPFCKAAFQTVSRYRLQDQPRVMRRFPKRRSELPPQFISCVIPRPSQIKGEGYKRVESIDIDWQKPYCPRRLKAYRAPSKL